MAFGILDVSLGQPPAEGIGNRQGTNSADEHADHDNYFAVATEHGGDAGTQPYSTKCTYLFKNKIQNISAGHV